MNGVRSNVMTRLPGREHEVTKPKEASHHIRPAPFLSMSEAYS